MNLSEDAKKIVDDSNFKPELENAIQKTKDLLEVQGIKPTELQWTILINHLNEMISRSKRDEKMTGVAPVMFEEVSQEALGIAEALVDHIGNLTKDEMYVLSIHFEAAKQNVAE